MNWVTLMVARVWDLLKATRSCSIFNFNQESHPWCVMCVCVGGGVLLCWSCPGGGVLLLSGAGVDGIPVLGGPD